MDDNGDPLDPCDLLDYSNTKVCNVNSLHKDYHSEWICIRIRLVLCLLTIFKLATIVRITVIVCLPCFLRVNYVCSL